MSTQPDRTGDAHAGAGKHVHSKAGICLHHGKTKIWNSQGEKPECVDVLEREARQLQPEAVVWRGNPGLPKSKQGLRVLGEETHKHKKFLRNTSHPRCAVSLVAFAVLRCSESQFLVEDQPEFRTSGHVSVIFCRSMERGPLSSPVHLPLSLGEVGLGSACRIRLGELGRLPGDGE